jgi:HTH-type transcriptional regulator/antitoxin HipB
MATPHPIPPQVLISAEQLGQLLRSTRKRLKLSQAEVGVRLQLSQNRVYYLELHPDELSFKQLMAWCAALELALRLGAKGSDIRPAQQQAEW